MKRVLFVSAINRFSEGEKRYPPLWPGYLSSYVKKHIGAGVFEFRYMIDSIEKEMKSFNPDIVAIGSVTQNFHIAVNYARTVKTFGLPVIIGGMHISALPGCLTEDMDVGCIGEGEQTFLELMKLYLDKGVFAVEELKKINGIVYHDNGTLVKTPDRNLMESLADLPHPDRALYVSGHRDYLTTSRGCPYKCVFCACSSFWKKTRFFPVEYVIEEIREIVERGAKVIRFNDDNFAVNKKRLKTIADMIISEGFHKKIKFSCWARANDIDEDIVNAMKSMNMVSVVMGLESGCQRILDYLKGNVTVEDNLRAVRLIKAAKIQVSADFVIGIPDETREDIMVTYDFIKKSDVDQVSVNVLSPLPGTRLWEYAKKRGLVSNDMDFRRLNFTKNTGVILSENISHNELIEITKKFYRLQFIKKLTALPRSPWLDELPMVLFRKIREKVARILTFQ